MEKATVVKAAAVCCAWCSKTISAGTLPISHGICADCGVKYFTVTA